MLPRLPIGRIVAADPPKLGIRHTMKAVAALPTTQQILSVSTPPSCSYHHQTNASSASISLQEAPNSTLLLHHPHDTPVQQLLLEAPKKKTKQEPILLLRGDELHVSPQGVARSAYQLVGTYASPLMIEEEYEVSACYKSFRLCPDPTYLNGNAETYSNKTKIRIQEIDTRSAGTGGTTWEASIVMSLYFATHPHELRGNVVELGSGVGLGGILLSHATHHQNKITFTDGNAQILAQCQENINQIMGMKNSDVNDKKNKSIMEVKKLDWYEVLDPCERDQKQQPRQGYQTVIACDCAYRLQDAQALSETLKALLAKNGSGNMGNAIHLFGPYNRVAFHEVIDLLGSDDSLDVHVDWIEMKRFRLQANPPPAVVDKSSDTDNSPSSSFINHPYYDHSGMKDQNYDGWKVRNELKFASQSTSKFLHVVAKYRPPTDTDGGNRRQRSTSLSDID
jgi:predicted nicotinamide N-methyase